MARALDIVGDRWTLLSVRDLLMGRTRFKEFLENSPGLPTTILSQRLKKLEEHGLVERAIYSQHPLRADYRLTGAGRTLEPVIGALADWGLENTFDADERAAVAERLGTLS